MLATRNQRVMSYNKGEGSPRMLVSRFILASVFLFCIGSPAASSEPTHVVVCASCVSATQFEAAAILEVEVSNGIRGEHQVLVINPESLLSKHVWVYYVPTGEVPMRDESLIRRGDLLTLADGPSSQLNEDAASSSSMAYSWGVSQQEEVEIGAIIEFTRNDFMIVFEQDDYFSSFRTRNSEAVALKIHEKMTDHNPGWAGSSLRNAVRELIKRRLERSFGKDARVCGIFNNGDSACFELQTATPSADKYIAGTAFDKHGNPLPDAGSGGGSGGGGLVIDNEPPNVMYAPRGSSGTAGELWLFCSIVNGQIDLCWTQVI